jgi:hypothetical protein
MVSPYHGHSLLQFKGASPSSFFPRASVHLLIHRRPPQCCSLAGTLPHHQALPPHYRHRRSTSPILSSIAQYNLLSAHMLTLDAIPLLIVRATTSRRATGYAPRAVTTDWPCVIRGFFSKTKYSSYV